MDLSKPKPEDEQEVNVHTHPTILAMMAKEKQAELLKEARGHRRADPYRDDRSSVIRRTGDRIMIALADAFIALGRQMKKGRTINGDRLVEARASCRSDEHP